MSLENLNAHIVNPEQRITLSGQSFGELIAFQTVQVATLERCVAAINRIDPHGENELLAEVGFVLHGLLIATGGVLSESIRQAMEQGLRIDLEGAPTRH